MAYGIDDLVRALQVLFGEDARGRDATEGDAVPVDAVVEDADGASGGATGTGSAEGSRRGDGKGATARRPARRPRRRRRRRKRGVVTRLARLSRPALAALGAVLALVLVLALVASYWWFHPALSLQSPRVWTWIIALAVAAVLGLRVASAHVGRHAVSVALRRLSWAPVAVIAAFLLGVLLSQPFFPGNAERFASVLETTDGDFAKDIEEVDYSEVPVIDRDSATLLGNRAMGSIPEYVSQFEVADTYSQINYRGRPVRVSPLVYADLAKWVSNRDEGIPAYVLVDMVTQEAQVVRLEQGIKYSESEPLARNIDRYVQLSYPAYMFDQKSFELDEEGVPWWVFPVQARTIGLFGGTTIQRVVLVNACTGETRDYAVGDCPDWVDRAYPSDLIIQQYNWSGAYRGGWFNSWLGQQGVVRTSEGTDGNPGYNYLAQNGDIYLYSGVTSATADNSIVGFILVNQRTGESRYYAVAGATESSAMESAEGAVQDLRYTATFPLLLNVAGQPTYFMALKDAAGLVKMFAMINVADYRSVATGSSVEACQESYLSMMQSAGTLTGDEAAAASTAEAVTGTITAVAQAVIDGNSHFYLTLDGGTDIYDLALPDLVDVVRYKVGDQVTLTWSGDGGDLRVVSRIEGAAPGVSADASATGAEADGAGA